MNPRNDFSPAGTLFKSVVAAAGALVSAYLLWKLRSLIVPVAVSGLTAYICRPLLIHLERYRVPRGLGIGLLLFAFVLSQLFSWRTGYAPSCLPKLGPSISRFRALYKLNERAYKIPDGA